MAFQGPRGGASRVALLGRLCHQPLLEIATIACRSTGVIFKQNLCGQITDPRASFLFCDCKNQPLTFVQGARHSLRRWLATSVKGDQV